MNAKWEKIEKNVGVLEVEVGVEKVTEALDSAFKKVAKQANVPGFRKGKVPRKIFESRFGVEVLYQDALDILLPEAYSAAVLDQNVTPVDRPDIDVVQMENGKALIFKATVTVKPEVELGQYKGLTVEKKEFTVTPEDIEQELLDLQKSHAEIVVLEDGQVENGDIVIFDFKGFVDGEVFEGGEAENYQLEIGSGAFIPGFEEQMVGTKKGEEKDINVTFPEEYHVVSLAGKLAVFKINVHEIKRKQLPVLDDEFAKDISEFNSLDELKADLVSKLQEKASQNENGYIEDQVVSQAVANASIDLPGVMIDNEIDVMMEDFKQRLQMQGIPYDSYIQFTGATEEGMRAEMRENAEKRVLTSLVLEKIAAAEKIEPTDDEVEAELNKVAESANMPVDRVRSILTSRDRDLSNLRQDIQTRKTISFLVENSKVA